MIIKLHNAGTGLAYIKHLIKVSHSYILAPNALSPSHWYKGLLCNAVFKIIGTYMNVNKNEENQALTREHPDILVNRWTPLVIFFFYFMFLLFANILALGR